MAYVTLKPGMSAEAEQLRAFALERVPERPAAPSEVIILEQMPVTAVGKIFKPSLRHDATRRAIQAALAPLSAEGITIEVEVLPHERHGTLTRVTAQSGPSMTGEQVRERIAVLLAPFIGYREVRVL